MLRSCQVDVERREHHTEKTKKNALQCTAESAKQASVCHMKEVTRHDQNTHLR